METLVKQDDNLENTHSFFTSKEHYLAFTAAWKQYIADGKHECETYVDGQGGTCKYNSSLTAVHHLVYNAFRKRDLHKSFAPLTNEDRINAHYSRDPYAAYHNARRALDASFSRWGSTEWIKAPFGGTVTDDMLKELNEVVKTIKL